MEMAAMDSLSCTQIAQLVALHHASPIANVTTEIDEPALGEAAVGVNVEKHCDGYGVCKGSVISFSPATRSWTVRFTNGVEEHYDWNKLSPLLRPTALPGKRTEGSEVPTGQRSMKPAGSRLTIPNKAHWTKEEDEQVKTLVQQLGDKSWVVVAEHMPKRTAKQIRERYCNHLRPDLKKGPWTPEEDHLVMTAHKIHGNSFSQIAKMVPGRTDNDVKNRCGQRRAAKGKPGKQDAMRPQQTPFSLDASFTDPKFWLLAMAAGDKAIPLSLEQTSNLQSAARDSSPPSPPPPPPSRP